uniref:Biogenesis of lysosome-related organelles complex 1 subunit 3 n=1 Tax=Arion vulgaris TaxID=1028688 RepID=A0A0B7BUI2_9EUPU
MDTKYKTVVQGEASESDEDDEEYDEEPRSMVVDGEAPESDEEEIDTSANSSKKEIPHLHLSEHSSLYESLDDITGVPTLSSKQAGRPKYDNVLNRKLWESNLSLCNNANGLVSQTYLSAAKDIANCSQQLSKSQVSLQDVSHNMRLMTNDCFNLQDLFDTVTTCKLLPNILLPKKPETTATSLPDHSSTSAAFTPTSEGQQA